MLIAGTGIEVAKSVGVLEIRLNQSTFGRQKNRCTLHIVGVRCDGSNAGGGGDAIA